MTAMSTPPGQPRFDRRGFPERGVAGRHLEGPAGVLLWPDAIILQTHTSILSTPLFCHHCARTLRVCVLRSAF